MIINSRHTKNVKTQYFKWKKDRSPGFDGILFSEFYQTFNSDIEALFYAALHEL